MANGLSLSATLQYIRRLAMAIAEGKIEASKVAAMTDQELVDFDEGNWQDLIDAQAASKAQMEKDLQG